MLFVSHTLTECGALQLLEAESQSHPLAKDCFDGTTALALGVRHVRVARFGSLSCFSEIPDACNSRRATNPTSYRVRPGGSHPPWHHALHAAEVRGPRAHPVGGRG